MPLSIERLELLHRVAGRGEEDARRALAAARQQVDRQIRVHHDLQGYRDEYQRAPATLPSPALLENRRLFVQRLRTALAAQASQVEAAVALVRQAEERWLESRRALRIAEQMMAAGRHEGLRVEERRAQRYQDDDTLQRRAAMERAP